MRQSIVIILAIAIIGGLGLKAKGSGGAPPATPASSPQISQSVQGATSTSPSAGPSAAAAYKDGTYTGASEDTLYGTVQIAVIISAGKITDVNFMQMPGPDGHSREVSAFAEPYLKQETLSAQSSNIQFVSGASTTSEAYEQSLQAALDQAA
jgi:uncharacterized protein with FMN-binding domain